MHPAAALPPSRRPRPPATKGVSAQACAALAAADGRWRSPPGAEDRRAGAGHEDPSRKDLRDDGQAAGDDQPQRFGG